MMSAKPKISVIIPTKNAADTLEQTLTSVINQNYDRLEIIIIDGGSTDNTLDIIKRYIAKINYWETGLDTGIANAFNRGIDKSTGDLITILNSDDYWEMDALATVLNHYYAKPETDIFHGQLRFIDKKNNIQYIKKPCLADMPKYMSIYHPTMFINKKTYGEIGLYDESYEYAMDSEWCHRAMNASLIFTEIPNLVSNMSLYGASDIHYQQSLKEYRNSILKHKLNNKLKAYIFYYLHLYVKKLLTYSSLRKLKLYIDKKYNKTVY